MAVLNIWHTSNTMYTSGRICIFSRLSAWAELRGYPSRSHPFCFASSQDNRAATIYKRIKTNKGNAFQHMKMEQEHNSKIKCVKYNLDNTDVTISSGTKRPAFMNSFALFPISVPAPTCALSKSPVDMCTNPNYRNRHNIYIQFYKSTIYVPMHEH